MLSQAELQQQALQDTGLEFITAVTAIRAAAKTYQLDLSRAAFSNNSNYWYRAGNPSESGGTSTLVLSLYKAILFTYTTPPDAEGNTKTLATVFDMDLSLRGPDLTCQNISSFTGLPLTFQAPPPPPAPVIPDTTYAQPDNPIGPALASLPGYFAPAGGDALPVGTIRVIGGVTYLKVSIPNLGAPSAAWRLYN